MFEAILGVLVWLGGGYFCGEFIIRWNQRHLLGDHVSPKKLALANLLNANLIRFTYPGVKLSKWRKTLTLMGPITMVKAAGLLLCGWRA